MITDTVPGSGTLYQVRVKAVDSHGLESAYQTGASKTISYNTPPSINGQDEDLGAHNAPISYQYTVSDNEETHVTVTETLTNGNETITLRTYSAETGVTQTAELADKWLRLLPGAHTLTIIADDGGEIAVRKITFSRTVTRIAAARAISTEVKVSQCLISLYPAERPGGAEMYCEATNNPFDDNPVWEDITDNVGLTVHTFENNTIENGYGLAYRFYITKGTAPIEIIQATVRFA
jgi:hypothetical protein